jgi:DNA-binding beta-propeller fold protein YncE
MNARMSSIVRAVVCTVLLVLAVGGSVASASPYVPVGSPFGSFTTATGLTVDQANGNVFVADAGTNEVQVFGAEGGAPAGDGPSSFTGVGTPSGAFKLAGEPSGPAALNGTVYVADVKDNVIDKLALNGSHEYEFLCEFAGFGGIAGSACLPDGGSPASRFEEPLGAAIDTSGDVYVANFLPADIYEFNPAGEEVGVFSTEGLGNPEFVAVASNGTFYAVTDRAGGYGSVLKFTRNSSTGPVEGEPFVIAEEISGIAYDDKTNRLFADAGTTIEELDSEGKILSTFGVGTMSGGIGVAVDETTGDVYAINGNSVQRFALPLGPSAVTLPAKNITYDTAQLCGTVNPKSKTLAASYQFQYGTSAGYGQVAPASPVSVGSGEEPVEVCTTVEDLTSATTYHYRIHASNTETEQPGNDETLTTAPPANRP